MSNNKKWLLYNKNADFTKIGKTFHVDPVIARIIRNRNITEMQDIKKFLYGDENDLYDPRLMKDADKLVNIIITKAETGKHIRIINDYDVDGVSSGYIWIRALRKIGANVSMRTPERLTDGYGINKNIIDEAYKDGVDTIITCDNGIAAIEEIAYAKSLGMTVLVTDHHEIPFEDTPDGRVYKKSNADAIVNPHQKECTYPFKGLCGAGVSYKLICLLYETLGLPFEDTKEFLEFAAFGTVADIMDLRDENRILVKLGLREIRNTKNIGMKALIEENDLTPIKISSYHFGFILGPCVNATGRLETAKLAVDLFLEQNEEKAKDMAKKLVYLNEERKSMTLKGVEDAIAQIEEKQMADDKVLVVYLPDVHESLAGIIAGRIREYYYRPVFVLTKAENGVKGSGRSIEEYSMYEEMVKCRGYFTRFGGHPMAAGLSMEESNIEPLRKALNNNAMLTKEDLIEKIRIDVPMPMEYASMDLVHQFDLLEPFGKGNTKPIFATKDVSILYASVIGKNQNVLKLKLKTPNGVHVDAIHFGDVEKFKSFCIEKHGEEEVKRAYAGIENDVKLSFIYYPSINSFRGVDSLQMIINDYC